MQSIRQEMVAAMQRETGSTDAAEAILVRYSQTLQTEGRKQMSWMLARHFPDLVPFWQQALMLT